MINLSELKADMDQARQDRQREAVMALEFAGKQIEEAKKNIEKGYKICVSNLLGNIAINLSAVDYYLADCARAEIAAAAVCLETGLKIKERDNANKPV